MSHGVNINEVPTGVVPPADSDAGLAVYVGTAPINQGDPTSVNKPVLVSTLAEYVETFGPIPDSSTWESWTLAEAASAHFSVYGVGPIVCINVIDPTKAAHQGHQVSESHVLDSDGNATLNKFGAIKSTVVVKVTTVTKTLGTDYTLDFDDDGFLVVTRVEGGGITAGATILVTYTYLSPSGVHESDIIGGYTAGVYTGLEVVKQVYPKLRLVPGLILAPKWVEEPTVAARAAAIANGELDGFRAMAVVDLSNEAYEIATYADAPAWKSDNGYSDIDMIVCWPKVKNGNDVYHGSTVVACVANRTDASKNGVPSASPSNKALTGTSAVLDDGTEVLLTRGQANSLNDQGIVTFRNGSNGWIVWGNWTGGYPGTTDPKDSFIPIRRMFNWIENRIILTTERDVDEPGNKRLIDGVQGTVQSFLNDLIATGDLVDGKIEFREDENSTTELSSGKITWHVTLTPPSPAAEIEFTVEYDPAALAELFG